MFVNTLIADGKNPFHDHENLRLRIERQLSKKVKTCSEFFVWFPESTSNIKDFEKKDDGDR